MTATWLFACDLDRTLVYSSRAAECDPADLAVVERHQGRDISYVTRDLAGLLAALTRRCELVPATTRTLAQYRRVGLLPHPPSWAITTNGGRILEQGVPDEDWTAAVRTTLAGTGAHLREVEDYLVSSAAAHFDHLRFADDLFAYAIVRPTTFPDSLRSELAAGLGERGWELSCQGRKLYAIPAGLSKRAAVAEVVARAGTSKLAAAGDSVLDAGMLDAADLSMRPRHGELDESSFPAHFVTSSAGAAAAAQILRHLAAQLAGSHDAPSPAATPVGVGR